MCVSISFNFKNLVIRSGVKESSAISQKLNIKDIMQFVFRQIDGTRCSLQIHLPQASSLHSTLVSLSLMIQKLLTAE